MYNSKVADKYDLGMRVGLREEDLQRAADEYFAIGIAPGIFPEMRELVKGMLIAGTDLWGVSSSNEWIIRAGMREFGIPDNRILAAAVEVENGIITDRIIRIPSGPGKPEALREVVGKEIDTAFGNSRWDTEMLAMAKHAFAVNPNPDLAEAARQRNWAIYFPDGVPPRP